VVHAGQGRSGRVSETTTTDWDSSHSNSEENCCFITSNVDKIDPICFLLKMRCSSAAKGAAQVPIVQNIQGARAFVARAAPQLHFHKRIRCNAARDTVRMEASGTDSSPSPNVEDRRAGRSTYRPSSYSELVNDALQSMICGLNDGLTRMEVEFPAVSNVDGELRRGPGQHCATHRQSYPANKMPHPLHNDNAQATRGLLTCT